MPRYLRPLRRYAYKRRPYGSRYARPAQRRRVTASSRPRYRQHELRAFTIAMTSDPNTTGAVVGLCAIAQGDDTGERQGNLITIRHLKVGGTAALHVSGADTRLRMMIIRDNFGTTTRPVIADMFADATVFHQNKTRLGNPQAMARFTVLWDKCLTLSDTGRQSVCWSYSVDLNSVCLYSGSAATDEGKGALYLFIASSEAANDPIVTADMQIFYTDN